MGTWVEQTGVGGGCLKTVNYELFDFEMASRQNTETLHTRVNFNIDILRKVIFFLVFSISFSYDKCFPCYMINVPRCSSAGLDSGERAG